MPRTAIREFELANPLYANCRVSFYTVAAGVITATLATLYDSASAGNILPNPQTLDSNGKFRQATYVDVSVIGVVTGQSVPSHSTGIINPAPTFRVDPTTSKLQYSYDAGLSWNDSGQTIFKSRGAWLTLTVYNTLDLVSQGGALYVALIAHTAGVFATDLAAGKWVSVLTLTASAIANVPAGGISATDVQAALNQLDTLKAPIASPTFTGDPKAPTPTAGDNDTSIATTAFVQAAIVSLALGASQSLVELVHINSQIGHRDLIQNAWYPAFFNQQWGGAPHYFELVDGATGTPYKFEAATQNIEDVSAQAVGQAAGNTWVGQGFKVSASQSISAVWVKISKTGNPANNLELRIMPDDGSGTKPTGSSAITNGTATAQSGKLHSGDTNGQWVRYTFATPCALTAGTQYHLVLKSSGAVDGTNYWAWRLSNPKHYPHGNYSLGDATPTWTATTTLAHCFMVEAATTSASVQTGGIFSDGKFTFFEGATGVINQSNGRVKDLRDFRQLDLTDFTYWLPAQGWTKGKPILEFMYGMDHDRISVQCNAGTGFPSVNVYKTDGSLVTVTGTVDVSQASNNAIFGFRIRAKNDGADTIDLWQPVANVMTKVATSGAISINFDALFGLARIGTAWIGGGFALAPTWTKDTTMSTLPSADGWTWTGTGTEANCMSVSGGKLYQNKNGYGSTDTGYYLKNTLALSNANGWAVAAKLRAAATTNTKDEIGLFMRIEDGTKAVGAIFGEYALQENQLANTTARPQFDLKSQDQAIFITGKGADVFYIANGRVMIDGVGQMTTGSANNQIGYGDNSATAGENNDAVWDYVKYYNPAWLTPQFSGGSLSEMALWNGDRTAIFATLFNAGTPFSVKAVCGVQKNYVGEAVWTRRQQRGITSGPSTASTTLIVEAEQELFVIGDDIRADCTGDYAMSAPPAGAEKQIFVDGVGIGETKFNIHTDGNDNTWSDHVAVRTFFGPHKVETRMATANGASTLTAQVRRRQLVVEARA